MEESEHYKERRTMSLRDEGQKWNLKQEVQSVQ
jgi:hypothetical protein